MFTTREEAKQSCIVEAQAVERFSKATEKAMANGNQSWAYDMADIAKTALDCARLAHEALWSLTKGNLTEEEFEAFAKAEEVELTFKKAMASLN
ncbi:TPA: hypothetical protein SUB18_000901 [Streptococcus equi subsp. zooepidemicus]|nr:hypothetical protein [Streptococcus equi subsp. zooepidemicus]